MTGERYQPGPVVWFVNLAATCLLLILFQRVLWLVVPFMFALVSYYLVLPLKQRLVLVGFSHDSATLVVSGGILSVLGAGMAFSFPLLSTQLSELEVGSGR